MCWDIYINIPCDLLFMIMDLPLFAAMMIGPVFALVVLQWPARRYEGFFNDSAFFASIVFGFFAGTLVSILHYASLVYIDYNFVLLTLIVSVITGLVIQIILTLKNFRSRKNLSIYALAFGSGMGSMVGAMIIYVYFMGGATILMGIVLVIYSFSAILVHGSAAAAFAQMSKRSLWMGLLFSVLVLLPYNMLALLWYLSIFLFPNDTFWGIPVVLFLYSGSYYYFMVSRMVSDMDIADRRRWRRMARKTSGGGNERGQ